MKDAWVDNNGWVCSVSELLLLGGDVSLLGRTLPADAGQFTEYRVLRIFRTLSPEWREACWNALYCVDDFFRPALFVCGSVGVRDPSVTGSVQ